jgi:hypothetical protein
MPGTGRQLISNIFTYAGVAMIAAAVTVAIVCSRRSLADALLTAGSPSSRGRSCVPFREVPVDGRQ